MYTEHPDYPTPPPEAVLWRYMDFTKSVSLLDRSALFFARADRLGDPFEGAYTNLNMHPEVQKLLLKGIADAGIRQFFDYMKKSRGFTLINCWYEGDFESEAMWRLYIEGKNGIALRTTFGSLSKSFTCEDSVFIGRVTYTDYDKDIIPLRNALFPYFHKRKSFEHEHEVRAIATHHPPKDVFEVGTYHGVDLSILILEVVVAPYADDWFVELVQSVASRYGLGVPVRKSKLAELPMWR